MVKLFTDWIWRIFEDIPQESKWWVIYEFLWLFGQFILIVLWLMPRIFHGWLYDLRHVRIIKITSLLDGKKIKYDLMYDSHEPPSACQFNEVWHKVWHWHE